MFSILSGILFNSSIASNTSTISEYRAEVWFNSLRVSLLSWISLDVDSNISAISAAAFWLSLTAATNKSSPETSKIHVPNTSTQGQKSSPIAVPVSDDSAYSFSGARGVLKSLKAVMSDTSDLFIPNETPQKPPVLFQESEDGENASGTPLEETEALANSTVIMNKVKAHELYAESDPIASSPTQPSQLAVKPKIRAKSQLDKYMAKQPYTAKELKEANKVTRTKEELLNEMVIQISDTLYSQFDQKHMEHVFAGTEIAQTPGDYPIISWRRKVRAMYDKERDVFIPCLPFQIDEKCLVVYYEVSDFVRKIKNDSFHYAIEQIRRQHGQCNIIVMIEGYQQHLTKIKNMENAQYKRKVLSLDPNEQVKRKKIDETIEISSKDLQLDLDRAQYELDIIVFPVRTNQEAIEWLHSFTYTIAFALYDKLERNAKYSNLGSVKSGVDTKDTFVQSMNQFKLMSIPRGERLFQYYKTMRSVYEKLSKDGTLGTDGHGKSIVPPSTENAMKRFFTSDDPNEVIHD